MANYELGERPVRLRRGRVTFEARIGEESVPVRLRTADPGAPIGGLWIPQEPSAISACSIGTPRTCPAR